MTSARRRMKTRRRNNETRNIKIMRNILFFATKKYHQIWNECGGDEWNLENLYRYKFLSKAQKETRLETQWSHMSAQANLSRGRENRWRDRSLSPWLVSRFKNSIESRGMRRDRQRDQMPSRAQQSASSGEITKHESQRGEMERREEKGEERRERQGMKEKARGR